MIPIPLQEAVLDRATLAQLFFDIAQAAEPIAVIQKGGAARHCQTSDVSPAALDAAHHALIERQISGVQLRYRFGGEEWWDTLTWTARGIRLIRISHTRALASE